MRILDNLRAAGRALVGGKRPESNVAYGNMWPAWEVQSPQYPLPNPYSLAQTGYRRDELVYACVNYRASTVSEPEALLYKGKGKKKEPVAGVFESFPRGQPNSEMSEMEFWQTSEIYRCVGGSAIWEIETNRLGEPVNLWPLNPSYCSFKRGNNRPLDKVVYMYPGLAPVDIPREKLIIFQNFDPLYPLLKGLSPTAVALRAIGIHNATSDFLNIFFQRGAIVTGYLKFEQSLNDVEAERARKRWRDTHGGAGNWGENNIGVLGMGADFKQIQMTMAEMAFAEVDGRTEAAICQAFGISPLLVGSKVGLNAATDTNFTTVRDNYYSLVCMPSWRWYAGEITQQLLPLLNDGNEDVYCEFDTSTVAALKEDEDALWARVLGAAGANLIYRDESRSMLGLEPVDEGEKVFLGVSLSAPEAPAETAKIVVPEWVAPPEPKEQPLAVTTTAAATPVPLFGETTASPAPMFSAPSAGGTDEQYKAWRASALAYPGSTAGAPFDAELSSCTSKSQVRAVFEKHWPRRIEHTELNPVLELKRYNDYVEAQRSLK